MHFPKHHLITLGLAVVICWAPSLAAQDVAITNTRIIVGNGPVIPSGTIIVRGGKIVSVGAGTANTQGLQVIDAKGMSAMPGFIDAHKHINTSPTEKAQMQSLLEAELRDFKPYVNHPKGVPLNQWADLNYSSRWSAYYLLKDGVRQDLHCERCPHTAEILGNLSLADVPNAAPTAFFSALEPRTRIPPHTGVTNARVIVHLPLIVPEKCGFRVGNDTRDWQVGKTLVFDDTIEHEAWNESGRLRVLLIFDIWNPYLTESERAAVRVLQPAWVDYYASDT